MPTSKDLQSDILRLRVRGYTKDQIVDALEIPPEIYNRGLHDAMARVRSEGTIEELVADLMEIHHLRLEALWRAAFAPVADALEIGNPVPPSAIESCLSVLKQSCALLGLGRGVVDNKTALSLTPQQMLEEAERLQLPIQPHIKARIQVLSLPGTP